MVRNTLIFVLLAASNLSTQAQAPVTPQVQATPDPSTAQTESQTMREGATQTETPDDGNTFTFIGPPDNDPKLGGLDCGIRFGMRQVISNVEGGRFGEIKRTGPTTGELTTFIGSQNFEVGKGVLHDIAIAKIQDEQQCSVAITILSAKPFKRKGFLNMWDDPPFTAADILIQTQKFLYRPTFTSPYQATALLANFDRLGVKSCNNVGVPLSRQIPGELRGDVSKLYCIEVDGQNIPVVPDCMPYRDGSQCTVLAVLTAERSGNTFDARPSATKLRESIETILND